ncbi:hypothetical protein HDF19_07855 [Mucilaginibacter sp. E4BP6]|uniref:hypothetical protein n=1 Tax=Mucilaginibacter sp. E4BP6 TaxID=2723089 RepID=UPI0015CA441F|nr:hypothetical protein [Mucilaginibacter sp. E4BP6]NYE67523.1 hypothetical protein [Mucilaginibacter sp. E4BP6]
MDESRKYVGILIIFLFILYQIALIIPEFSSYKVINVRRNIYNAHEPEYLNGYKDFNIQGVPFEEYAIKVQSTNLWDYLLLTNYKGNLLSSMLEIFACVSLACFVFQLEYENFFSNKSFNWAWVTCGIYTLSVLIHSTGNSYTRDFWQKLFVAKGGGDQEYDFQYVRYNLNYIWILIFFALNFCSRFVEHHTKIASNNEMQVTNEN